MADINNESLNQAIKDSRNYMHGSSGYARAYHIIHIAFFEAQGHYGKPGRWDGDANHEVWAWAYYHPQIKW